MMLNEKISKPVLKKCAIASLLSLASLSASAAETMTYADFYMYDGTGNLLPGSPDTTVAGTVGDGAWSVASTTTFFGSIWTAHSGTTFGPGTYSFDTVQAGSFTGVQVGAGQVGGHILFNWGANSDIDVVNVWNVTVNAVTGVTTYTSTDPIVGGPTSGPDGILGVGMIDGPFLTYHANFNFTFDTPPTAVDDTAAMAIGAGSTNIDVRANDTDYSGATVTGAVTLTTPVAGTAGGGVVLETDNTVTYTPSTTGVDTFGYTVVDGRGVASGETTVTVTVTNAPVAYASDFTTTAGVVKDILIGDTADTTGKGGTGGVIADDGDGDTLQFATIQSPTDLGGTVTVEMTSATNDTLRYTPPANTNTQGSADDTFTITVIDPSSYESNTVTFSVGVDNATPTPAADTGGALPNVAVVIDVLANDSDYEDGAAGTLNEGVNTGAIAILAQGSSGNAVANGDGTVTFTAGAVEEVVTFTYTLTDSDGATSSATNVDVTVSSVGNDLPVAYNSDFTTDAGSAKVILITDNAETTGKGGTGGVIADDLNGHTLSFVSIGAAANGSVAVSTTSTPNDTLTYTPDPGFNGVDTFTFSVNDGIGDSVTSATMTMNVTALRPVANDDTGLTMLLQDVTKNINVVANDTDVEDDATATALVTVTPAAPTNGTAVAVLPADGTIDYTPTAVGVHTFTYTVTDSDALVSAAPATVTITVTAAPETLDVALATDEDVALTTISLPDPLIASDADGDALTFATFDATTTQGGSVTVNLANDTLTYTPAADFNGIDTFTYTVTDGTNTSSSATNTMTVTVAAVDDAMSCPAVNTTTAVDMPVTLTTSDLVGSCADADGAVTLLSYGQPAHGVVTDDGAGNLTYTPVTGFIGADSFDFTATDGAGGDTVFSATVVVSDDPSIHIITGG
ncbi:MAG: Ig-like domain-containing protein, partial [Gammaproteobacteria bacterium]|nr:Ig-like domain-containing protein [Gammaproteobacteria bacterium]